MSFGKIPWTADPLFGRVKLLLITLSSMKLQYLLCLLHISNYHHQVLVVMILRLSLLFALAYGKHLAKTNVFLNMRKTNVKKNFFLAWWNSIFLSKRFWYFNNTWSVSFRRLLPVLCISQALLSTWSSCGSKLY